MKNIICRIKSKIGIIYSLQDIEIASLDETFPEINRNKYIGLCVSKKKSSNRDIMYIAHFSIVKKIFYKYIHLVNKDRRNLEETANWMNVYENMCIEINKDILGEIITKDSLYSMDLPRYLEKLFHEKINQKEICEGVE